MAEVIAPAVAPTPILVPKKTLVQKVAVTALWIAVSAAISYLIGLTTSNPVVFGAVFTPLVNIVLVTAKNLIDPNVQNV